jgi:hypothetical protein
LIVAAPISKVSLFAVQVVLRALMANEVKVFLELQLGQIIRIMVLRLQHFSVLAFLAREVGLGLARTLGYAIVPHPLQVL